MVHHLIAEAPWSAAEWAGALRFVELLQAQPGRHGAYYFAKVFPPAIDKKRQRRFEIFYSVFLCLHKEINASRFSGPEQFSAGAPLISHLFSKKCELFCPHFPSRHF